MLRVEQVGATRKDGRWLIRWRFANQGSAPVEILSAWLPHSRFRGEELEVGLAVAPGNSVELLSPVACDGLPGEVIENAFLILRLSSGPMFARLRVTVGDDGVPLAVCEAVT